MFNISFSWDDGAVTDLKIMEMSLRYEMPAIFFMPVTNPERPVISKNGVAEIAGNNFEIGAHTYSHSYLTQLPLNKADEELVSGKDYYEQLLGRQVPHFCFPGGKYNSDLVEFSKEYFKSARTADTGALGGKDSFLIKPAFHFYDRGKGSLIYHSFQNSPIMFELTLKNIFRAGYFNFMKDIIKSLSILQGNHNVIIWGHSWEIENLGLWHVLEDLFHWIRTNYPLSLKTYSELLDLR